jgi:hypothetical protein
MILPIPSQQSVLSRDVLPRLSLTQQLKSTTEVKINNKNFNAVDTNGNEEKNTTNLDPCAYF